MPPALQAELTFGMEGATNMGRKAATKPHGNQNLHRLNGWSVVKVKLLADFHSALTKISGEYTIFRQVK
jgi:hypothetical protein